MAIEHSITFGGVNSADFGIYISGEGVFNAPERDVEMVEIPGRNGELALDKGRFKNIEVTYPAFNYEEDYDTFVQNLSDFRNAICSQIGYQRLSDTFHPDEYRMATFIEGLEVEPIKYNTASKFDIVFDCKPQRWLTDGETAVTVDSGDVISNPTLFDASPLLEVEGYGTIEFNGYEIELEQGILGEIVIASAGPGLCNKTAYNYAQFNLGTVPISSFNSTDTFTIEPSTFKVNRVYGNTGDTLTVASNSLSGATTSVASQGSLSFGLTFNMPQISFTVGQEQESTAVTNTVTINISSGGTTTIDVRITYHRDGRLYADITIARGYFDFYGSVNDCSSTMGKIAGISTISLMGNPTYIDCDLGEAYKYEGGEIVSLNKYIDLGSDLPKLASGANTITFDNTITDLKVVPRWWKI